MQASYHGPSAKNNLINNSLILVASQIRKLFKELAFAMEKCRTSPALISTPR